MLFLYFLSLISSQLFLFIELLPNLHIIYAPASTILGVFPPGAYHFESTQSLGEYAQISAGAEERGKGEGTVQSKAVKCALTSVPEQSATPPSALLCGEKCQMSV